MKEYFLGKRTKEVITKLQKFLTDQDSWTRTQVAQHGPDPFWRHVGMILAQFDGLVAGYQHVAPKSGVYEFI